MSLRQFATRTFARVRTIGNTTHQHVTSFVESIPQQVDAIGESVKRFLCSLYYGFILLPKTIKKDFFDVREGKPLRTQEDYLYLVAKYAAITMIAYVLGVTMYMFRSHIDIIELVGYCAITYVAFGRITASTFGDRLAHWMNRNPRAVLFAMSVVILFTTSFIVYDIVKDRSNTTAIVNLYVFACSVTLTSVAFTLFVGIDGKIKQLQRRQLEWEDTQRPIKIALEQFDVLNDYAKEHRNDVLDQTSLRHNGVKVMSALQKITMLKNNAS